MHYSTSIAHARKLKTCIPPARSHLSAQMEEEFLEKMAERPSLSLVELKDQKRKWMMTANYCEYDIDEPDGFVFPHQYYCDVCGSARSHESKTNLGYGWFGLGPEEHCWSCGAEPEHHDPFFRDRFDGWRMDSILEELNRVGGVYHSRGFMTRKQIEKNREYFIKIAVAIQTSDSDFLPGRYEFSIKERQARELHTRVMQLAVLKYDGDWKKAEEEYGYMSTEVDDLCTILDELENHKNFPDLKRHPEG